MADEDEAGPLVRGSLGTTRMGSPSTGAGPDQGTRNELWCSLARMLSVLTAHLLSATPLRRSAEAMRDDFSAAMPSTRLSSTAWVKVVLGLAMPMILTSRPYALTDAVWVAGRCLKRD